LFIFRLCDSAASFILVAHTESTEKFSKLYAVDICV